MYLVDANVFIEAKNRYYAFDIAPGFWEWLERAHNNAIACSIEQVRDELLAGQDELADWANAHRDFFKAMDSASAAHLGTLTQWASSNNYEQAAVNAFVGNSVDYFLVAYARAHGHTLVTHEQSRPNSRRRIKIPDACIAMRVKYADTFAMLRNTQVKFQLICE
jgi:hypothetical protein